MGWMGDAQVFAPTAARLTDVAGFFSKWLVDVNDAQGTNGDFSTVSPRANQNQSYPVWADAGVIIPWAMYVAYGDKAFLEQNYAHMTRWVDFSRDHSNKLIRNGGVGDHLAPKRTPIDLVDTAYFANSARIVAKAAELLGKEDDAAKYEQLHRDIVEAFQRAFVSTNGTLTGDTQTGYILALQFDLLPHDLYTTAARRLAENVEANGHLTTGFVGVGQICPALTLTKRPDLAWKLLLTDTYPSWLFSVKNGATTIWERWDGWTPERGFQDSSMNSFNHYSFGSIGAWLYSGAAGIQLDEEKPGYKHFFLRPQFTPRLSFVKATFNSPYGLISSHWHVEKEKVVYDVVVPPNTTASMHLPFPAEEVYKSGVPLISTSVPGTHIPLPAGSHHFSFARRLIE
jgi:alpha-L-rhamnosidase